MISVKKFLRENVPDTNLNQRIWDIEELETLLDRFADQRVVEELERLKSEADDDDGDLYSSIYAMAASNAYQKRIEELKQK
tara:strand:+ start:226 stop:468 length:243 start_codon:yes stop_codon:yes gene_type:complete